jgi:TonB-dependent receptor
MTKMIYTPRRAVLLAGISIASLTLGVSAHAQDATSPDQATAAVDDGDIVVTGVRASLSSAQAIKRNSDVIVDSIVAEDIGKLPDRNVAEALQRITGVQIQRQYGEGSSVAIRGLTQVRTELNGRDIFTASGANQLNLEDIPSELLAGIDVYKNPSADLIEDQLSGTINFRTRKPFDYDGLKVAASFTQSHFDLVDKFKPSASLMVSDRWDTGIGEIGILASVSFQKTAFRQDTISTEPFYTLDQSVDADGNPVSPVDYATAVQLGRLGQTTTLPHGTGIGEVYGDRRRLGTDIALQWRPSDTLELTAEVFRSDYKFRFDDYSFFAYSSGASITPQPGAAFTYADNGDFQSGTFINVPVGNNTSAQTRHSTTTDYSLNLKWKPTSNLTVTADGQYVDAKTKNLRSIFGLNGVADTLYQDISGSVPVVNIGSATGLANASTYTSAFYLDNLNESKASDKTARLDAEYRFDAGILSSIKAGLRYADRKNRTIDTGYRYTGLSGIPSELETVDLGDFFRGDADLFGNIIAFNRGIIRNYQNTLDTLGIASAPAYTQSGTNAQRQKTFTGYATAFFKADPVDGNIGVRVIRTNLDVSGYYQQTPIVLDENGNEVSGPTVFNPIAVSQDYTSVLPSLNLRVHLTDNLQVRFAAAKNISRPNFTQLNPSLTISEPGEAQQDQIHTANGGNPYLKPMKSDNLDATLEWYFSRTGSLTAAAFYKNIKNYIQTAVSYRDVTFDNGNSYEYEVTSYNNVAKGKVKGFELAYQQFFDFLPGPFDGLGMQANFTYVDSQAPSPATSGPVTNVPLELLSKYNYNIIGIYEKGDLSARVAYNWRSKYVVTTAGNGTGTLPIFNKPFGQLDASVTYNVTEKFGITLDGTNLTNTRRATYFGIDSRPRDVVVNDRRINLTARISY